MKLLLFFCWYKLNKVFFKLVFVDVYFLYVVLFFVGFGIIIIFVLFVGVIVFVMDWLIEIVLVMCVSFCLKIVVSCVFFENFNWRSFLFVYVFFW